MRLPLASMLLAVVALLPARSAVANMNPHPAQPRVEVVFCIDRSGSMKEVIETAKKKVWSIVNEVAKAQPSPVLRIGLVGYGNGEQLVHKLDLTDDLDEVYKHLTTYTDNAPGGAEFVGHAIHVATRDMRWSPGPRVLKIVYVVGNETARQGPAHLDYATTAPAAIAKGIMVNAIYCGSYDRESAPPTWREFAKLAEGQYMEIAADGGNAVASLPTPFDAELAGLNDKLNGTYVAYGARGLAGAGNQVAQDVASASLSPGVLAERAVAKSAPQYSNSVWDLVDASKQEGFDLKNIRDAELPDEVRKLPEKERPAYVARKAKERAELQKSIQDLAAKREQFVKDAAAKAAAAAGAAAPAADSFDVAVRESLRKQAEGKGFTFEK